MPAGNGITTAKTNVLALNVFCNITKSIVTVKTAFLCMGHALIIAMTKVNRDNKYTLHRKGKFLNNLFKIA